MKKRTVKLAITNCLDCPFHKEQTAPYTGDSFDMCDTEIICTKTTRADAIISVGDRPWKHREYCDVPDWCPLIVVRKKAKDTK